MHLVVTRGDPALVIDDEGAVGIALIGALLTRPVDGQRPRATQMPCSAAAARAAASTTS
jgi:hypothetical protein